MKKSLLELGGSDAFIVLADANLDKAVEVGIEARFQNAGQVCLAAKRFILQRPIAEAFAQKFVAVAAKLKAGDPLNEATTMGPIARGDLRDGIHDQVQRSIASGAKLLLGGKKIEEAVSSTNRPCSAMSYRAWRPLTGRSSDRWLPSRSPKTSSTPSRSPTRANTD
jgi:succinate-semialdehyde dehydrogenase